jgi:hypothetical protein
MKITINKNQLTTIRIVAESPEEEKQLEQLSTEADTMDIVCLPTSRTTIGNGPVEVCLSLDTDPELRRCWE